MSVFAQDYYTWVDANGITNYAQQNPQGLEARLVGRSQDTDKDNAIVDTRSGSRPGAQAFNKATQQAEQAAEQATQASQIDTTSEAVDPDQIIADDRAAMAAKIAEQKRDNCNIGKKQLTTLKMYNRIRIMDENGEERILTEEEKSSRTATARQIIRDNCTT
ncbi:MAG: hypothetical protein ACJATP_000373 [Candidatus Azotimanducaceae bacterium]|jgi:hypothetical protein